MPQNIISFLPRLAFAAWLLISGPLLGFCNSKTVPEIKHAISKDSSSATNQEPSADWQDLQKQIEKKVQRFPGNSGIYIQDLKHGWVIAHNADRTFPSASLIKVPIMITLYQEQQRGRITLDEKIKLERRFKSAGSGKLRFKRAGTFYTVRDLIHRMITESDNTATNILSDLFGIDYYEKSFQQLGLQHTNFSRTIMDLKKRDAGIENWTTPRDMAKLLEMIYYKKLPGSQEMLQVLKDQKIKDRLPFSLPRNWIVGNKTGLMRGSCHDVAIVFAPHNDYLICVLTSDLYNIRRCKRFIREIARLTAQHYAQAAQQDQAQN